MNAEQEVESGGVDVSEAVAALEQAIEVLKGAKPNDRSELDRWFAIILTDTQKALGNVQYFIVQGNA